MVEFGPAGTQFLKPVKVTLPLGKAPKDSKLMAYCYDEVSGEWVAVSEAAVKGSDAVFEVSHFSLYAVGGKYDYVNGGMNTLVDQVGRGMDNASIFAQLKSRIESQLENLFSWDIIGGLYYSVGEYSEKYAYCTANGEKDAQGMYKIGTSVANWSGYHDIASLLYRYMADSQSLEKIDYNTYQKALQDKNEVYGTSFERELHLVPSTMSASIDGDLQKKGDQATVRFKLAAKTTGGTVQLKVCHSCHDFVSGQLDETPAGQYDYIKELPYDDPSLGQNPPMAYQTLKLSVSDPSSVKLSKTEVETDEDGMASVTVTALKDAPESDVTAKFDYTTHITRDSETDHSEASVHIGGGTWYVTGIISDIRPESMFGVTASMDFAFEFSFDPSKPQVIDFYGYIMPGVVAYYNLAASNVHISNGHYSTGVLGWADYTISNVQARTLSGFQGFVDTEFLESNGIVAAIGYNLLTPEVQPQCASFHVHTDIYASASELIDQSDEDETWPAPTQYLFPLKPGHYSPIILTAENVDKAQTDTENFYILLGSGTLMEGHQKATLTGDVIVSREKPE